jgi:hypothetical protein
MPEIVVALSDEHIYTVNGGIVPGFTEIATVMKLVNYWNKDPWYMERGRAVHSATYLLDMGKLDWTTVDPRIEGFLEAYENFKRNMGITWQLREAKLYHRWAHYCGTLDGALPELWDIKTGEGDPIQLEAYAELMRANGYNPGFRGNMLNLHEDGKYSITMHRFDRVLRNIWLNAVNVYHYRKMKGLL